MVDFRDEAADSIPARERPGSPRAYLIALDRGSKGAGASDGASGLHVVETKEGRRALEWAANGAALGFRIAAPGEIQSSPTAVEVELSVRSHTPGAHLALRIGNAEIGFCQTEGQRLVIYTPERYPEASEVIGFAQLDQPFTIRLVYESVSDAGYSTGFRVVETPGFHAQRLLGPYRRWEDRGDGRDSLPHLLFWTPTGTRMRLFRVKVAPANEREASGNDARGAMLDGVFEAPANLAPCVPSGD